MQATVSVQGVFKELVGEESKGHPIRSFNRIFVIMAVGRNEWQIVNEIVHISNSTEKQVAVSIIKKKGVAIDPTCIYIERLQRANDENGRLQCTLKGLNVF